MKDIIIIGAGPAGLAAAIYGQRAGKTTLLIEQTGFGGQIINSAEVENYPGVPKTTGIKFAQDLYDQAIGFGAEIVMEKAIAIEELEGQVVVKTNKSSYVGRTVIIATGAKNRPIGLDEESKYVGSGLSYCATCDGMFFRNRDVAVIGGGNTALEDAETLSGIARKVYLVHRRDYFRGEDALVSRLKEKENVEFIFNSVAKFITGEMMVSNLIIENTKTSEVRNLPVQGIFVAIGQMPDNEAFVNVVDLEKGYVKAKEDCKTKSPGVFTAGDCRTKSIRQLATATSDGAVAALAAVDYINNSN